MIKKINTSVSEFFKVRKRSKKSKIPNTTFVPLYKYMQNFGNLLTRVLGTDQQIAEPQFLSMRLVIVPHNSLCLFLKPPHTRLWFYLLDKDGNIKSPVERWGKIKRTPKTKPNTAERQVVLDTNNRSELQNGAFLSMRTTTQSSKALCSFYVFNFWPNCSLLTLVLSIS